jgi:hypothetical protein
MEPEVSLLISHEALTEFERNPVEFVPYPYFQFLIDP